MAEQHSPLPWRWEPRESLVGYHDAVLLAADGSGVAYHSASWPVDSADAAFIVRCVNSHAALLDALKGLVNHSECCCDGRHCDKDCIWCAAKAAIALAEATDHGHL